MLFSASLRSANAMRSSAMRQLHSTAKRFDMAESARQAAQSASKQFSGLAERAQAFSKPVVERASKATGCR
jgi:hypothetical protein